MGEVRSGMRRGVFVLWVGALVCLTVLQSAVHLEVVLAEGRVGSIVDLDRSNSVPDLVSTIAVAAAASAAIALAHLAQTLGKLVAIALACSLALVTLADFFHDGPHPGMRLGWVVTGLVVAAGLLLVAVAAGSAVRCTVTLGIGCCLLLVSPFAGALDNLDPARFERERGDPIAEYQIVTKEGLEFLGWSLVALALWDEALRRRAVSRTTTARASRARAASRRRAA